MKKYPHVQLAKFICRPNRFIAECQLMDTDEVVVVHVKNTGRCQELLYPEVVVALSEVIAPHRKTNYDLIAVKKGELWVNIDSQVPNELVYDGLKSNRIQLPGLKHPIETLKREVTFGNSKFDLAFTTVAGEKGFIEVKGMTLEKDGIGAFPDAPTIRGLKHVEELRKAHAAGYLTYIFFVVQLEEIKLATIHTKMQPPLEIAIATAIKEGVEVVAFATSVTADSITLLPERVPFQLNYDF